MRKIKILIADDHSMVREGIKQLIEMEEDIEVIEQAGNGKEAIEKIESMYFDAILLDINMPITNGLEVLRYVKDNNIKSNIIVLTIHNEVEYLYRALDIGAKGYVLKDSGADVLIDAIRTTIRGKIFIEPGMHEIINRENLSLTNNNKCILTNREMDVLKLITDGMLNKEIAHDLCISEKTVKNHVSNIFKKLNVSDRTQAAVYAIKNKLVNIYE